MRGCERRHGVRRNKTRHPHRAAIIFTMLALATTACQDDSETGPQDRSYDEWQAPAVDAQAGQVGAECPPGTQPIEPGCGEPPPGMVVPEPGCRAPCAPELADCASGEVCVAVYGNPCICDPGDACCRACGAEQYFCMPVLDSCPPGEVYAEPGCGGGPATQTAGLSKPGCYEPCKKAGDACENGGVCADVWLNPCICPTGDECCQACGGGGLLCLDAELAAGCIPNEVNSCGIQPE